jgi:hypothetical protein
MLKTLGAGALGFLRFSPANTVLQGQAGAAEKPAPGQILISTGNPGIPLMFEVWGRPPGMNLPEDLRMASAMEFAGMLKTAKENSVKGMEYYVSWGFAEPEEGKWDWSIYKRDAEIGGGKWSGTISRAPAAVHSVFQSESRNGQ